MFDVALSTDFERLSQFLFLYGLKTAWADRSDLTAGNRKTISKINKGQEVSDLRKFNVRFLPTRSIITSFLSGLRLVFSLTISQPNIPVLQNVDPLKEYFQPRGPGHQTVSSTHTDAAHTARKRIPDVLSSQGSWSMFTRRPTARLQSFLWCAVRAKRSIPDLLACRLPAVANPLIVL